MEGHLGSMEQPIERIPTPEEIKAALDKLINGRPHRESRRCEDENGPYLLEIVVPGEKAGGWTEYSYVRRGKYPESESLGEGAAEINVIWYENEQPFNGSSAARYVGGEWKFFET